MARPRKKKRVLFILEIVVLMLFIGGLYVYGQITTRLDKVQVAPPDFKKEEVLVNAEAPKMTGYKTYAVFGVDSRKTGSEAALSNSDTMMIVSVNNDTKEVKMVSLYRDTLLNVGNGTYTKANAAYAAGGPQQAISMLNTNLDLNITDYATADFSALVEIVDAVGGLDIPMSYDEIEHMNNYCVETSEVTGKSYTPIERPETPPADTEAIIGTYHLNGVQATSYCRIRYTSSMDMGRTERQRLVISMIVEKAKTASLTTLFKIVDSVFPMVETSISKEEILKLIPIMLGYDIGEKTGFPINYKFANVKGGSCIVPTTLESNVVELHKILYGTAENYTPSSEVVERSNKILEIVGGEDQLADTAVTPAAGEENDDNIVWNETDSGNWDTGSSDDGSWDNGSDDGSYDNGSWDDGSYDDGSGDGSYDDGSWDDGSGDGSYDDGSGDGSYDDGSGDGSYDDGSGDGSYDDGSGDGGYDDGSGDGSYDDGWDDGSYDDGSGDVDEGYIPEDDTGSSEGTEEV